MTRQQKITLGEMRASGVRGLHCRLQVQPLDHHDRGQMAQSCPAVRLGAAIHMSGLRQKGANTNTVTLPPTLDRLRGSRRMSDAIELDFRRRYRISNVMLTGNGVGSVG